MGNSILELVLRHLGDDGFTVCAAYPGQMFPQITEPVAAVHIQQVDRANLTVTLEISLLYPGKLGGSACELEALRITESLRTTGAVCVQKGCSYDGASQLYTVAILATYTGVTETADCKIWPGFYCHQNTDWLQYATSFTTERTTEVRIAYGGASGEVLALSDGKTLWNLELVENIPVGGEEIPAPEGEFSLRIVTDPVTEVFTGCRWTSVKRQRRKEGLYRVCKGYAQNREVSDNGESTV